MSEKFNGSMLTLARQWRRVSQVGLIEAIHNKITQGTLSKIEHGRLQPDAGLVDAFADTLKVRRSFFFDSAFVRDPMISYHRKRQSLSTTDLQAIHAEAEIYRLNLRKCFDAVEIENSLPSVPAIDPDQFGRNIEDIAAAVRQRWKLPRGPVADLTKTVEDAGTIVIRQNFGTPLIDGFCQHACDDLPHIVFLNAQQPRDRLRFSLAHEIGHLVMHHTPHPQQEMEANQFAAAFLMPAKEIIHDFFHPSIRRFQELKSYWGVSMHALVYRAWTLGTLDDRQYKYFMVEMSKRGWKRQEPLEPTHLKEEASTLKHVIEAHLEVLGYTNEDVADLFGLTDQDFTDLYQVGNQRPRLRLVSDRK
jgi:Zn-dependent peptidase ImmA (M78 family)/transcriptional regulator with XRE-family HTH domain